MSTIKTPVLAMSLHDNISDDVFESIEEAEVNQNTKNLSTTDPNYDKRPSTTGYRDYKPPSTTRKPSDPSLKIVHKTILLGDSGVGKTSLLVKFDTGKFQTGNFSATVGIGFTVMVLGDSGVGKTCLLVRFRDDMFLGGNYISTVGVDFRNKIISVDDSKVKLQIWDTAGQERFRSVTHAYYRDAHALLLLYDVTNKVSFDNIRAWLSEIRDYANDQVVIMLIGNKADCSLNDRMVKREDGEQLAKEYSVTFMETSAKSGFNVEIAFMAVARELLFKKTGIEKKGSFNVQDYVKEQTKSNCPACSTA
ncbi:ras-related protein Rab-37 isoform X3 [Metopolophium dirhodum]|uniref:ras-related protein Rab-37 isoform X3 n=1 Tax=Metopolophium dirhodum TaxID=44670 RepID=UPI00298F751B|nr:ras-related protein Rab-37 isoform X3 [Metopolophium dirhodum]